MARDSSLTPELMELVGERFKALAEPVRLNILQTLGEGEMTVSELMDRTGLGQANASKHLQMLYQLGFVDRRKEGLFVYYRLADDDVFLLCDIMCGRIERASDQRKRLLDGRTERTDR